MHNTSLMPSSFHISGALPPDFYQQVSFYSLLPVFHYLDAIIAVNGLMQISGDPLGRKEKVQVQIEN